MQAVMDGMGRSVIALSVGRECGNYAVTLRREPPNCYLMCWLEYTGCVGAVLCYFRGSMAAHRDETFFSIFGETIAH
jgi:hypothetical protein